MAAMNPTANRRLALLAIACLSLSVMAVPLPAYIDRRAAAPQLPPGWYGTQIHTGSQPGKCLKATGNQNGAAVSVADCSGDDVGQKWSYVGGTLHTEGLCLDVTNGNGANGATLQLWQCYDGNANQQWSMTPDARIAWTNQGQCLDLTDGTGDRAQLWKCTDNDTNQVWNMDAPGADAPAPTPPGPSDSTPPNPASPPADGGSVGPPASAGGSYSQRDVNEDQPRRRHHPHRHGHRHRKHRHHRHHHHHKGHKAAYAAPAAEAAAAPQVEAEAPAADAAPVQRSFETESRLRRRGYSRNN